MVGEDTHGARLGEQVDLDDILRLVDGLEGCGNNALAFPARVLWGIARLGFGGIALVSIVPGGEGTS